jgi:glycerol-3-phosphate dehydrogenase
VLFRSEREWARTAEDILWRRTKQGLFLTAEEAVRLEDYMAGALVH